MDTLRDVQPTTFHSCHLALHNVDLLVSHKSGTQQGFILLIVSRIYNGVATLGLLFFFFPEKTVQKQGDKLQSLKKVDVIGGVLSITGITLLYATFPSERSTF